MSRWRSQNPKSFDQGYTGVKIIFLKTLIVLIVKFICSECLSLGLFIDLLVGHHLSSLPIYGNLPHKGGSCKMGSCYPGWNLSRATCFLSLWFGSWMQACDPDPANGLLCLVLCIYGGSASTQGQVEKVRSASCLAAASSVWWCGAACPNWLEGMTSAVSSAT